MNKTSLFLATILLTSVLLVGTPSTLAQDAPAFAVAGSPRVDLFVGAEGLESTKPTGADQKKTITGTAGTPGLSYWISVGQYEFQEDVTIAADGTITAWIVATQATVVTSVQGRILKGTTVIALGSTGNYADSNNGARNQVGTTPMRFELGLASSSASAPMRGTTFAAGDKLDLQLIFFGFAGPGTPTEAFIVYGSDAHPTGVSFPIVGPSSAASGTVLPLYLGDNSLTSTPPTEAASKKRASTSAYQGQTAASIGSSSAWTWGTFVVEQAVTMASDSFVTVFLSLDGNAVAWRGLRAQLYIGGALADETDVGIRPTAYQSASGAAAITEVTVGFNTMGKEILAGDEIRLDFLTWSATGPTGSLVFLYGSVAQPSVLVLSGGSAAGAPSAPLSISVSAPQAEKTTTPGGAESFFVDIANSGTAAVNVTYTAESNATVILSPEGGTEIGAANSTQITVNATAPVDAEAGTSMPIVVRVFVADAEVANITLNLTIVAASPGTGGPGTPGGSSASNSTSNETASAQGAGSEDTPGVGAMVVLSVVVALAVVARRRRA